MQGVPVGEFWDLLSGRTGIVETGQPQWQEEVGSAVYADLNGQHFVIDYVATDGTLTQRRITVSRIVITSTGECLLRSWCYLRSGWRSFRVDRITAFADPEGEIYDSLDDALSALAGTPVTMSRNWKPAPTHPKHSKMFAQVTHEAQFLAGIARADGRLLTEEVETALDFLAWELEAEHHLDDDDTRALGGYFKRKTGAPYIVESAAASLMKWESRRLQRLFRVGAQVMDCDGERHASERDLLDRLSFEIFGTGISA